MLRLRPESEIDDLLNRAADRIDSGETYPGLTFEEGIRDGIDYALGRTDEDPLGE